MPAKILIVGTIFKDDNSIITQGEILYEQLKNARYNVLIVSKYRAKIKRSLETVWSLLSLSSNDILILQVYATQSIYLEVISVWIARLRGGNVISTLHGGAIPEFYLNNSLKRFLLNQIFRFSHEVTVPSTFIVHVLPIIQAKAKVVNNFLTIPMSQKLQSIQKTSEVRLFWIRAYSDIYDPFKAVDVVYTLVQIGQEVHMHMAGPDMGLYDSVKLYIDKKGLSDHITLHKKLSYEHIGILAQQCMVYLCTNKVDNAPVTFLEMMVRGLPIVSTSVGGIPFFVKHRQEALLASSNTADELADLILELHQDNVLFDKIREGGKKMIEKYDPNFILEDWKKLLESKLSLTN